MKETSVIDCFRCSDCGKVTLSEKVVCSDCGSFKVVPAQVDGEGIILDSTIVNYPPENYKDIAPYTSILVELPDGCRFFAMMEGAVTDIPLNSPAKIIAIDEERGGMFFQLKE